MRYTNLHTESPEYLSAREALRDAEQLLVDQRERVAELRRRLPPGAPVSDYTFVQVPEDRVSGDAAPREIRLSELFTSPGRSLIIYHLMFGKRQTSPCPMCTMWIDGFNGVARHVRANADFAIVAAADVGSLSGHAARRGWDNVRLLSAGAGTFKQDLGSEDADGNQGSQVSVFSIDNDGTIRHDYSVTPSVSDERDERGIDALCATWGLLDLLPRGRGDWYASLDD